MCQLNYFMVEVLKAIPKTTYWFNFPFFTVGSIEKLRDTLVAAETGEYTLCNQWPYTYLVKKSIFHTNQLHHHSSSTPTPSLW